MIETIAERFAHGSIGRTEADLQADVRAFLLEAPLDLGADQVLDVSLEAQVGIGRRIDVEAGRAVFEVKKSLSSKSAFEAALEQLAGYVRDRAEETGQRFVGVLTDGRSWILFHLTPSKQLEEVDRLEVRGGEDAGRLAAWLDVLLATTESVRPTPKEIVRRLGSASPAAQLELKELHALYLACRDEPEVQLKRELWSRLLQCSLGTSFEDSDTMFVTHTYLVLIAELVAHEIMGLPIDLPNGDVRALLEGQQFAIAQLHGVVEADFFDWPALLPQGQTVVAAMARRLATFDWSDVKHDVLKALYESLIDSSTRHRLGEYYTPDWLAQKIVDEQFRDPLKQRLLDPACGSGTFLFWAVRRFLRACDEADIPNHAALEQVVDHVQGMDLHPVAVTLARVTYLLAITPERLLRRSELTVPVFLGDSMRWQQADTVRTDDGLIVSTADPLQLVDDSLHFPEGVLRDPNRFDRLVADLARRAAERVPGTKPPGIAGLLRRHRVTGDADREAVVTTFKKLCRLHDAGRDHLWSYYIRNMARPLSFIRTDGQVDVLLGNPPWLAFRSMPGELQRSYRHLAQDLGLWAGGKVATQQDLSDLFVARVIEQYLRPRGTFAFVMPFAVLSRRQFAGFRRGSWGSALNVRFEATEEFSRVKPPLFPVPACVVSGYKHRLAAGMPRRAVAWSGRLPADYLDWPSAAAHLTAAGDEISLAQDSAASPYRARFRQGATLVPRMLVMVEPAPEGPLGVASGFRRVRSARSSNEKQPWKVLPGHTGVIEEAFAMPIHLGETIVAYRARPARLGVIPMLAGKLLDGAQEQLDEFAGLAAWWRDAERVWEAEKSRSSRLSLGDQLDFQGKLRKQYPVSRDRVVYSKSGQHLAACRIEDADAIIDHTLYWAAVSSVDEGRYLCAVLNSQVLSDAVRGLQSRGQHNPRHFDMHVFSLPFPMFDRRDPAHMHAAALAERAEQVAATVELDDTWQFQKARRVIREALREDGVADEIDRAVADLLNATGDESGTARVPDLMDALPASQGRSRRRSAPGREPSLREALEHDSR